MNLLKPAAMAVAIAFSGAAAAQYDNASDYCTFTAPESNYASHNKRFTAGSILIEWSPSSGQLFAYSWYADTIHGDTVAPDRHPIYSEYLGANYAHVTRKTAFRSSLLLDARLFSHYSGSHANYIHGRLFNAAGGASAWNFSGILEQTGSGIVTAHGDVHCD